MLAFPSKDRIEVCIDEAGRGCLMGDVCAAAVIMPCEYDDDDMLVKLIKDSKKLTPKKRMVLAEYIKKKAIAYGIGIASAVEIDQHNILQATYIAMHRALDQVLVDKNTMFDHILVDGDKFKDYLSPVVDGYKWSGEWVPCTTIIDGDNKQLGIAAASILAKTHRDNIVDSWVEQNPEWNEKYGFGSNKGYGTKKHMMGLSEHGALEIHRKSFGPVARVLRQ